MSEYGGSIEPPLDNAVESKRLRSGRCMIEIFRGAGVVTPSKPPPPYEQLSPLPTPVFRCFGKIP